MPTSYKIYTDYKAMQFMLAIYQSARPKPNTETTVDTFSDYDSISNKVHLIRYLKIR
jgi:hypothetical protein